MPRKPSLDNLRATLQRLTLEQKQALYAWLGEAIARESTEQTALETLQQDDTAITETRYYQGKTYQHEKRRCHRAGCKCMTGEVAEVGHGPYWYAYWKEKGKLRSQYVGKRSPWGTIQPH
jgi:hypothetical protein